MSNFTTTTWSSRVEGFSSPDRAPYMAVMAMLKRRKVEREMVRAQERHEERLPCRVTGEELQALEREFGWKLRVVDRSPSMTPFATARHYLLSVLNRRIKSWDGEEVVEFDREMMRMCVKGEHWVHCCRTYSTSEMASSYIQQEHDLLKAVEGKRLDISQSASRMLSQVKSGGGDWVCLNASTCTRIADTVLIDLSVVSVSAPQALATVKQHQAQRAKVFFYFETDMFVEDEGDLSSMPGRYLIDRSADMVHIFPDGQPYGSFSYSFSAMMSYIMEAEAVHDGNRAVIEIHDTHPGVCFAQVTPVEGEILFDSEVETRFYRPAGESMTVIEQHTGTVTLEALGSDYTSRPSRIVLPTSVVNSVFERVASFAESKVTMSNARVAVKDFSDTVVTKGIAVYKPRKMPVNVPEALAEAAVKYACRVKAEMAVEKSVLGRWFTRDKGFFSTWVDAAMSLSLQTRRSISQAVSVLPAELAGGWKCERDYTMNVYELDPAYVVRNVVRSSHPIGGSYRSLSCMPGGFRSGSSVTSQSSSDVLLSKARAFEQLGYRFDEVGEVFEIEKKDKPPMTSDRKALVDKMVDAYDAHAEAVGARFEERIDSRVQPPCSKEVEATGDPIGDIQTVYDQLFPKLIGVEVQTRSHVLSSAERNVSIAAPMIALNGLTDEVAKPMQVRRSKLLTGVSGRRPLTQVETVASIAKRIANAPRAQADRVFNTSMDNDFERVARVCFRADWRNIIAKRLDHGMWRARQSELERNVAKLDTSKVTTMLREDFIKGEIDMQRWKAMVKTVPKPTMSEAVVNEQKGLQTIVYQGSKMTNSLFSSILSEFHDTLDEILLPHVRVNVRRDRSDVERWFNSWQRRRDSAGLRLRTYETDISQCDKSHILFNLLSYFNFMKQMGAPQELISVWEVMTGSKKASAATVGLVVEFFEQLTSGAFLTISLNSIVVLLATVSAFELESDDLVSLQVTGDDGLVETTKIVDVEYSNDYYRDMYNFEARTYLVSVPYFCSRYYVWYDNYWFVVKDPIKAAEAMGRYLPATSDLDELHESYKDDMIHYDKMEVMDALAESVRIRMEYGVNVRGLIRGLSSLLDFPSFQSLYKSEVETFHA